MRSLTLYPCARSSPRRQHASHRRRLATAESLERRDLLAAFPAWTPMDPLGGLVYGSSLEPQVLTAGATDQHTLQLPTDQALSVVITPTDGSLQATVELRAPDDQLIASASASAAGEPVALQDVRLGPAGSYEIVIGGANATGGGYAVRAAMNATLEVVDATTADPLAMDGSRTSATLGRYGALGQITPVIDDVVEYREDFDGPTNEFVVDNSTGSGNGLWHVSTVRQADGLPGHSPPQAFYFGQGESSAAGGNYNVGATGGALDITPRPPTGNALVDGPFLAFPRNGRVHGLGHCRGAGGRGCRFHSHCQLEGWNAADRDERRLGNGGIRPVTLGRFRSGRPVPLRNDRRVSQRF